MFDAILILIIVVLFSEKIRNRIPDSETGFLGFIRKMFSLVSLHSPNVK